MLQPIQLPVSQYNKLARYKDTLGCSSDAELIGILTQTFLCTLAQPLSISSKQVDMLLTQGQHEPKIRNIMMALLVQFLSSHTTREEEPLQALKPEVELLSSEENSLSTSDYEMQVPEEHLSTPTPSPPAPTDSVLGLFTTPSPPAPQDRVFTTPIIRISTPMCTSNPPSPSAPSVTLLNTDVVPALPAAQHCAPCTTPLPPANNTPLPPTSTPTTGEYCSPVQHADSLVQGPLINSDNSIIQSDTCPSREPSPSSSPSSSITDSLNDTVDLVEVLKALKNGGDCQDEVVNKLVGVINELVENTEFSLDDIIEMMKTSLEPGEGAPPPQHLPPPPTTFQQPLNGLDGTGLGITSPNTPNLRGILLPANWVPVSFNQVHRPSLTTAGPRRVAPYTPNKGAVPTLQQQPALRKKSNICNTCNTSFSQFSSLLRHIRQVHQKIKDKPCPLCGERFARSQYLPNHIWRTHYNRAVTNVKCFFCPEVLEKKEGIQQHLWLNHVKARR